MPPTDMQHALSLGSKSAAEGYTKLIDLFQKFGQQLVCKREPARKDDRSTSACRLGVFTYFTLRENPAAIYLILAMPSLMALFLA